MKAGNYFLRKKTIKPAWPGQTRGGGYDTQQGADGDQRGQPHERTPAGQGLRCGLPAGRKVDPGIDRGNRRPAPVKTVSAPGGYYAVGHACCDDRRAASGAAGAG